jgi:Zn-dependent M28 family amino/carboxypeptidase
MTSRQLWIALAVLWFLAVSIGWIAYFSHVSARAEIAVAAAQWRAVVRSANPTPRDVSPTTTFIKRVERKRLAEDLISFAQPRATDSQLSAARAFIGHRLTRLGYTPVVSAFGVGVNIIADLKGTDPMRGVYVIAAHLDTVPNSPGADDNATGVVATLELARLFKMTPPKASLRFVFFDAEEKGLLGSRAYVRNPNNLKDLRGVVVLEMIGYACRRPGCQRYPNGVPDFIRPPLGDFVTAIGNTERLDLLAAFTAAADPEGPRVIALPVPQQGRGMTDTRRSDHAPFWDHGIGAVMLTDTANFRNPHYHQASDTVESLDLDYFSEVVELTRRAVKNLADRETRSTP